MPLCGALSYGSCCGSLTLRKCCSVAANDGAATISARLLVSMTHILWLVAAMYISRAHAQVHAVIVLHTSELHAVCTSRRHVVHVFCFLCALVPRTCKCLQMRDNRDLQFARMTESCMCCLLVQSCQVRCCHRKCARV